MSDRLKELTYL